MGTVVQFPTPLPLFDGLNDAGLLREFLNELINYINTIAYGDNIGTSALLRANNLSDLNNAATARTNLGLGTAATMSATAFDAAGAAAAAQAASLQKTANLSDLANAATARTNLGLGSAATMSSTAFDPAGAAAARAAAGVNHDITALTALAISSKVSNYQISAGDQTILVDASGGAVTITYLPATVAGRVKIVKTDATFNPVNISNGTTVLYSLVAPANGLCQTSEIFTTGAALVIT